MLARKQARILEGKTGIENLEGKLKSAKAQMQKYLQDYDDIFKETAKVNDELEEQVRVNTGIRASLKESASELDFRRTELAGLQKEIKRVKAKSSQIATEVSSVEKSKRETDEKRELVKEEVKSTTKETATQRKASEILKKQVDDLLREREILNKSLVKAEEKTRRMFDLIKVNENSKKNLENEINGFKVEALRQRQSIEQLEDDVKRYDSQGALAHQKYYTALEETRLQEAQIVELQKKIAEGESKLRQQQNLYEAVRSDRNMYSKNLIQSQASIAEMKR